MSGIELVGLAASVLQIADLGWKSSYKLYAFSKKVHDAGKSIELVSQDIAATGAILKQLGEELRKDEENTPASRVGTQGLTVAASKLVDECQTLFKEIDQGITGEEGSKVILGFKQKLKWSYLEPRVDLLRTNLERLKSSLALMLNDLIYAEQHRSRQAASVLKEQQKLVASFAEQKNDSEKRIEDLKRRIELPALAANPNVPEPSMPPPLYTVTSSNDRSIASYRVERSKPAINVAPTETMVSANVSAVQILRSTPDMSALPARLPRKALPVHTIATAGRANPKEPPEAVEQHPQLDHHRQLFDNILEEVNSSKYALDHGLRYRLHDGVLELHWREWEPLRATHGDQKLLAVLSRSPLLARHWYEKAIKPVASITTRTLDPSPDAEHPKSPIMARPAFQSHATAPGGQEAQHTDPSPAATARQGRGAGALPFVLQNKVVDEEQARIRRQKQEKENRAVDDIVSGQDYVLIEKRAVEVNALADDLNANLTSAVDEADTSDSDETFVYESNPPDPRGHNDHSRAPSGNKHGIRSGRHATGGKKSMKFSNSAYNNHLDNEDGADGHGSTRNASTRRPHHIGRHGRNAHASILDTNSPFNQANRANSPRNASIPHLNRGAQQTKAEDVAAPNDEIKFVKQQDVSSTRNALRVAPQAEGTGRSTHVQLERVRDTDVGLDDGDKHGHVAEDKAKEPKTLNRSMFAVHLDNPLTAKERYARRDEQIMDRYFRERKEREATQERPVELGIKTGKMGKGINEAHAPRKINLADRARYQFDADSEDDEMESPADDYDLGTAEKRLTALLGARGVEVATEGNPFAQAIPKSDTLSGHMSFSDPAASIADRFLTEWTTVRPTTSLNTERLKRIR